MGSSPTLRQRLAAAHRRHAEPLAEFLGTFVMVSFGVGVVAQVSLNEPQTKGDFVSISVAWGVGVAMAACMVGRVSGAHLNPAVTVALAVHRGFPWRKVGVYVAAQVFGAFCAAGAVYVNQRDALDHYDAAHNCSRVVYGPGATAGVFATYPAPFLSISGAFYNEALSGGLFFMTVLALTDTANVPQQQPWAPVLVGASVCAVLMSFGGLTGPSINPARDLGPRILTALAGWGADVFTVRSYYFWVPSVGPVVGMVAAGFGHDLLLRPVREGERAPLVDEAGMP